MWVEIIAGKGQFWGVNVGHPIVTTGGLCGVPISALGVATRLLPNYFGISCSYSTKAKFKVIIFALPMYGYRVISGIFCDFVWYG